jgi:hypothetical protein
VPQRLAIRNAPASPRIATVGEHPTTVQFTIPLTSGLNALQITVHQAPGLPATAHTQTGVDIAMTNWRITRTR